MVLLVFATIVVIEESAAVTIPVTIAKRVLVILGSNDNHRFYASRHM